VLLRRRQVCWFHRREDTDGYSWNGRPLSRWYTFLFLVPCTRLRAFVAALGISDEVDRLGLKGSKKKKSKKLDEDWMVIVAANSLLWASTKRQAFTANTQAIGSQGGAKSYSSYATNPEPQGPCQVAHSNKGQTFGLVDCGLR